MDTAPQCHEKWRDEVRILLATIEANGETDPAAIVYHFMIQCVRAQFPAELERFYERAGAMIREALETDHCPAIIVKNNLNHKPLCKHICVSDIRNLIVFEALKRRGVVLDTYFTRSLDRVQPTPTPDERQTFQKMAHGMAMARDPKHVERLAQIVSAFYIINTTRKIHHIAQHGTEGLEQCSMVTLNGYVEVWIHRSLKGYMIQNVWDIFRDLFQYEYSNQ